ncbi:MAG: carboxypeptidase regulatory-like domain-containing protein [Bacteroidetes bacterium]|nr:carboxypeptidase regulatory-like domain-containing protein [Bacteroidota bacterium]
MIKKYLSAVLLCIIASISTHAQKLSDLISQDTMMYVFKLNKTQTDYIIRKQKIEDIIFLFGNIWKSYPIKVYKNDTLPFGNYICASINKELITYTYVHRTGLSVKSKVIGNTIIIFIGDQKNGKNIEKAKVEIDGKNVAFDEGFGGYAFEKNSVNKTRLAKNEVYLTFSYGEEYTAMLYNFAAGYRAPAQGGMYNAYAGGISEGYFITDKPVYKPLDTLRLKAFLTEPHKGRPIRSKAWLTMYEPTQNFNFSKRIKPKTPGAFVYDWPIPDSLKIDRNFSMSLTYKKRHFALSKQASFYLEDYVLNSNKYDAQLSSQEYYAGDDIRFTVTASDANGFPIQGAQIHYKLSILNVYDFICDTFLLPVARKNNWLERDTVYPYENAMELKILHSDLPKINATYNVEITITDPNTFERKVINRQFNKQSVKEKVLIYQREDSLHIRCLYNQRDTGRNYTMIVMNEQDTLMKKKITTPYVHALTALTTRVIFIDKDSSITPIDIAFNKFSITHLEGKRNADSVFIDFKFPFDDAVYYHILKNGKRISSGKSKELHYKIKDDSKDEYMIRFTSNLHRNIENNFYEVTYKPQLHKIFLSSDLPTQAFPGARMPVTIKATDYRNKALKKINIAAFAVNKQFEDRLKTPVITIPEKYRDLISIKQPDLLDNAYLTIPNLGHTYHIKSIHFTKFNLHKNEFYELRYPKKTMALIDKTNQSKIPEFSVFVTHKDRVYRPKYILLDGQPIYITDLQADIYSFQAKAGKHSITIRYFDKRIELNDISFEPNKKYFIGLNIDSLGKSNSQMRITDSLSVAQPNADEKSLLYGSLVLTNNFGIDTLTIRTKSDTSTRYTYTAQRVPQRLNVDGENFSAFGPFPSNSEAVFKLGKKEFALQTGTELAHYYDWNSREFTTKRIGAVKGVIFNFAEQPMYDFHILSLAKPDSIKPTPEKVPVKYNDEAHHIPEPEYNQSYRSNTQQHNFSFIFKNANKKQYVKALWVINTSKPEDADFLPGVSRSDMHRFYKNGREGVYDIYLLMNDNKMIFLPKIYLHHQDEFYIDPTLLRKEILNNDKLSIPLKIYSDLTKTALLPFYFAPEEINTKIKETANAKRKNPYLHGIITNESLSAIYNALVLLEVNGVYKYGATTNSNGEFEILNIADGSYQVKIYHPEYQIKNYAAMFMKGAHEYTLDAAMKSIETQRPAFETIHPDFQLAVFANQKQQDLMKLSVYDNEFRTNLLGSTITLLENDKPVYSQFLKDASQIEIPTPTNSTLAYTLELKREGYTTMYIRNLHFYGEMIYQLNLFASAYNPQIPVAKKEYDVNMQYSGFAQPEVKNSNAKITYHTANGKEAGVVYGKVLNEDKEALDFASISLIKDNMVRYGGKTDLQGNFNIKSIAPGEYDVRVTYVGYESQLITKVSVSSVNKVQIIFTLQKRMSYTKEVMVMHDRRESLINPSDPGRKVVTGESFKNMASNQISDLVGTQVGVMYNASAVGSYTYQIDGLQISSETFAWSDDETKRRRGEEQKYANDSLIEKASNNASSSRKNFTDVAYWQPNKITNKKGIVSFDIQFPDNITTWKSNILAMGKKRMHGIDSSETKVYKPLQTISIFPQFLYQQDKVYLKAKYSNLTKDAKDVQVYMSLNDQSLLSKNTSIKNDYVDSAFVSIDKTDTLHMKAGLIFNGSYKDEEVRDIPVYSPALKLYNNQHFSMESDSTYRLQFANQTKGSIMLNNTLYEKILEEIKELNQYEYACTEQCASKLKGLLVKEKINKSLGLKDNITPQIYQLLNRLAAYQNNDGSWGWWKKDYTNWRMTLYVMDVMQAANSMGYFNSNFTLAQDAVRTNFGLMNNSEKLYAHYLFQKNGIATEAMMNQFKKYEFENLPSTDKMYYFKIQNMLGEETKLSDMYALYLEMNTQLTRPYTDNFFYDPRANIFNAYQLFSNTSMGNEWLQMFKAKLSNGQLAHNLNTYAKASMIEALSSNVMNTDGKTIQSEVIINDTLKVKTFPYRLAITGTNYTMKHSGGNVFVNTAEEKWMMQPTKQDSIYQIQSSFEQQSKTVETIKAGIPCTFKVSVDAYKTNEHVMLEIPIPAGMRVVNKAQQSGATIEYFKQKIVLFFPKLHQGQQTFYFEMLPNIKGSFMLPAAKCSLMYYPHVYGNNENKTIEIK